LKSLELKLGKSLVKVGVENFGVEVGKSLVKVRVGILELKVERVWWKLELGILELKLGRVWLMRGWKSLELEFWKNICLCRLRVNLDSRAIPFFSLIDRKSVV
jgi:hypothetical protein